MKLENHIRIDKSSIESHKLDHNGYLDVTAFATRSGVFTYRNSDGSTRRELRHPDEVFKQDSLQTLLKRPVVDEHPQGGIVNSKNTKFLQVGFSGEKTDRSEDDHVKINLLVTDQAVIDKVVNKNKVELSCGYRCDTIPEEGEYNGERYDYVQINIIYNHIALVHKGRAGDKARIYLDSIDSCIADDLETEIEIKNDTLEIKKMTIKLKLDSVSVAGLKLDAENIEYDEAADKVVTLLVQRNDSAISVISDLQSKLDTAIAEKDTLQGSLDETKQKLDEGISVEKLDSLAKDRAELVGLAGHIGLEDFNKLDSAELKKTIVLHSNKDLKLDNESEGYIQGRLDSIIEKVKLDNKGKESLAQLKTVTTKTDGKDDVHLDNEDEVSPREKLRLDTENMWQKKSA